MILQLSMESFNGVVDTCQMTEGLSLLYLVNIKCQSYKKTPLYELLDESVRLIIIDECADTQRYIPGQITEVECFYDEVQSCFEYEFTLRPDFAKLEKIIVFDHYWEVSIPEVIESIFKSYGLLKYRFSLLKNYPKQRYIVCHKESLWNFIMRLLTESGIYFYFDENSILCLSDHAFGGTEQLFKLSRFEEIETSYQTVPKYIAAQETFLDLPHQPLSHKVLVDVHGIGEHVLDLTLPVDDYQQLKHRVEIKAQYWRLKQHGISGKHKFLGMQLGQPFTTEQDGQAYYCYYIRHHISGRSQFTMTFQAYPVCEAFVSEARYVDEAIFKSSLKPHAYPKLATVTGPKDEKVYTNSNGDITVQFDWDNQRQFNETSSPWIPIRTLWSGDQRGAQFIPKVGMRVLVDFERGCAERPFIIGTIASHETSVPNLGKHQNGLVSQNKIIFDNDPHAPQIQLDTVGNLKLRTEGEKSITLGQSRQTVVEQGNYYLDVEDMYTVEADQIALQCGQSKIILCERCVTIASDAIEIQTE